MKKNLFTVAAVALVAFVSCNKETNSPVQPAPVSDIKFEAEIAQTKTAIGKPDSEGNRDVTWVLGDQVNINGTLFTATGFKEDGKAIFETELDFTVAEQYDAIYPATAGTSLEAVTIAAAQDGTFANAAIAVAQSENRSLSFLNVASLLRFQVPADYASVTIESTEDLAGTVSVSFNEELPVIGEVKNASKTVTLKNVKAGVDYYVAILPGDHKFTVKLDGRLSKEGTNEVAAERANLLYLGVLPQPAKLDRNLAFSVATATADTRYGLTNKPSLAGITDGVKYSSSKTSVATVNDGGEVTILAVGETTITASAPESDQYKSGSATYTLTVNQGKIKIYVYLYPQQNNWSEWMNRNPYIHYFNSKSIPASSWPGVEMANTETYDGKTRYYYEFNYDATDKISVVINNNNDSNFKQTVDVIDLKLDTDHSLEVWTSWKDGKLEVGVLK